MKEGIHHHVCPCVQTIHLFLPTLSQLFMSVLSCLVMLVTDCSFFFSPEEAYTYCSARYKWKVTHAQQSLQAYIIIIFHTLQYQIIYHKEERCVNDFLLGVHIPLCFLRSVLNHGTHLSCTRPFAFIWPVWLLLIENQNDQCVILLLHTALQPFGC